MAGVIKKEIFSNLVIKCSVIIKVLGAIHKTLNNVYFNQKYK